jgi:membrane protein
MALVTDKNWKRAFIACGGDLYVSAGELYFPSDGKIAVGQADEKITAIVPMWGKGVGIYKENSFYWLDSDGSILQVSCTSGCVSPFSIATLGYDCVSVGANSIYGVKESRGYLYTRGISMVYTFLFLLMLLATLVLNVFGTTMLQWLPFNSGFLWDVVDWRFLLMLLLQTGLFTAMFMALPNQRNTFRQSLPGALLASSGWLIFSDLYSIYVEHFAGLTNVYGSVYAVALSMLWLYFCMAIVFYGGALNRLLNVDNL